VFVVVIRPGPEDEHHYTDYVACRYATSPAGMPHPPKCSLKSETTHSPCPVFTLDLVDRLSVFGFCLGYYT